MAQDAFITTWETRFADQSITIPTESSATDYDFSIDWGDGTTEQITGTDPDPSHTYSTAGTYTVTITGTFPRIVLNNSLSAGQLQSIEQWGTIEWESMEAAFAGASNLTYNATDTPDLSGVTSLQRMFANASSFNGDIGDWDVSNVTNMRGTFRNATSFNRDIGSWDVSSVEKMRGTFEGASSFNQDIGGWTVSKVNIMFGMFSGATSFNQDISDWDVSNVKYMNLMFRRAEDFNQDIGGWDVSSVIDMTAMFEEASAFDQDLGDWDVSNVTAFGGSSFGGFLERSGLSPPNYDALLIGWSMLDLVDGITFNPGNVQYSDAARSARRTIIDQEGWTINDGGLLIDRPFATTWETTADGETITIPTANSTIDYDFTIDWGDGITETYSGADPDPSHTYASAGTHTIEITGTFPRLFLDAHSGGSGDATNAAKLQTIEQWGAIYWENMAAAFAGAGNVTSAATDVPILANVSDLSNMFRGAGRFNGNLGNWDVGNVTAMEGTFAGAASFNADIGDWDVRNVTTMREMFQNARSFDRDLRTWDVSSVTDMNSMFQDAETFDPYDASYPDGINEWDVSSVTTMREMFLDAQDFDQDVSAWDVSSVTDMNSMFQGASKFDQPIGPWDVSGVTDMGAMFKGSTFDQDIGNWDVSGVTAFEDPSAGGFLENGELSPQNYNALLTGWAQQSLASGLTFDAGSSQYTSDAESARQSLIDDDGWTVEDGGLRSGTAFITTWETTTSSESITIHTETSSTDYDFTIDWGDGTSESVSGPDPDPTHTYASAGLHTIEIRGTFPRIRLWLKPGEGDPALLTQKQENAAKLQSIDQWGTIEWESMRVAFGFAVNVTYNATDTPVLTNVTDMRGMFFEANSFNGAIGDWDVSSVTNMRRMFDDADAFNADIGSWDVSNVQVMREMFRNTSFNQDINGWDVSGVQEFEGFDEMFRLSPFNQDLNDWEFAFRADLSGMFLGAKKFNGNITGWDVSEVRGMASMFGDAESFNRDIGGWDVSEVSGMAGMFSGATSFNQDIGGWNISSAPSLNYMFRDASSFNQDISGWDVSGVDDMISTFEGATNFNQDISGWDVSSVKRMNGMFEGATSFNQDISGWDVSRVENMTRMFAGPADDVIESMSFAQNIGVWDVSSVTNMKGMFAGNTTFNEDISGWDVSSVEFMSSMFQNASSFNQDIGGWDVSSVKRMKAMFNGASNFDQNIGGWDVSNVEAFDDENIGGFISKFDQLSRANYDSLLVGWARHDLKEGVSFTPGNSKYSVAARPARDVLTEDFNWTIDDGGLTETTTPFVTVWTTTSAGESITIPTASSATNYDFEIKWGDGTTEQITGDDPDPSHTYSSAGEHTVKITGTFPRIFLNAHGGGSGDAANAAKLQSIEQWGTGQWESMAGAFAGAEDLTLNAAGAPVLTNVTSMRAMFAGATVFNGKIRVWNVSNVTDMAQAFDGAAAFNRDIGRWDVSSVTDMASMFRNASAFNQEIDAWAVAGVSDMSGMLHGASSFDQDLVGWDVSGVTSFENVQFGGFLENAGLSTNNYDALLRDWEELDLTDGLTFDAGTSRHTEAVEAERQAIIDDDGWTIKDGGVLENAGFITTWETTSSDEQITIPTTSSSTEYDFEVNWGDGVSERVTGSDPDPTHTYASAGTHTVEIIGVFPRFFLNDRFDDNPNSNKLQSIQQWGVIEWESMEAAFAGAENLTYGASDTPDLSKVTSMKTMFAGASSFNGAIGDWDVSTVTDMTSTFSSASTFNQDIGDWNVSSVTEMPFMFSGASAFDQDIGGWDVSSVENMNGVFNGAAAFNGNIEKWNVSGVKTMSTLFDAAEAFNRDISGWDVSSVEDMSGMFRSAQSFNRDLSEWDVSTVTDMSFMFAFSENFDQNLGAWNLTGLEDGGLEGMLEDSNVSTTNYDRTLVGWAGDGQTDGLSFGATGLSYCNSGPFRRHLIQEYNWDIVGDDQKSGCPTDLTGSGRFEVFDDRRISLGNTGVDILLKNVEGSGYVSAGRFDGAPRNVDGISESTVSQYRIVLVGGGDLTFGNTTEIRFNLDAFGGISDASSVTVYKRSTPGTGSFTALSTNPDSETNELVATTGSFSEFVLASNSMDNPLPVEMASFEATAGDENVRLSWATASETNNAGFRVQRRVVGARVSDGQQQEEESDETGAWSTIGSVDGAGTTSRAQSYQYTDRKLPYADTLAYRLKQVDASGNANFSDKITVERRVEDVELLGTFPNPAQQRATVQYALPEKQDVTIRLYDVLGRRVRTVVHEQQEGRHERMLDVSRLSSGVYFLRLRSEGEVRTQKVTVVR